MIICHNALAIVCFCLIWYCLNFVILKFHVPVAEHCQRHAMFPYRNIVILIQMCRCYIKKLSYWIHYIIFNCKYYEFAILTCLILVLFYTVSWWTWTSESSIVQRELHVSEPQPSMKHLPVVESFTRPISVIVLPPEADDSVVDSGSGEPRGRCQKATHWN